MSSSFQITVTVPDVIARDMSAQFKDWLLDQLAEMIAGECGYMSGAVTVWLTYDPTADPNHPINRR